MDLEKQAHNLNLSVNHQRLNDLKEKFRADDFGAENKIEDSFEYYFGKGNLSDENLEIYFYQVARLAYDPARASP